jgi:Ca2+-binding EF-hand superfamily protein
MPAKKMRADRVWLLNHNKPEEDKGNPFILQVEKKLKNSNIECKKTLVDRTDLFDILRAFHKIILEEQSNSIFVNVSVGSKIQAIASMMACMMFKDLVTIKPYYVVPEEYNITSQQKQETEGMDKIIALPDYKIEIPSNKLVKCLEIINNSKNGKISKKELKGVAIQNKLIHVGNRGDKSNDEYSEQAGFMALNKTLIEPLLSWRFITVEKVGSHHVVSLTIEGRDALRFLKVSEI